MPKFKALGEDLANIVCDFAFLSTYHDVFHSLKSYLQILAFKVPNTLPCFFTKVPPVYRQPARGVRTHLLFRWIPVNVRLERGILPVVAAGLSQSSGKVLRVPWSMAFTAHADLDHCSGLCYLLSGAPPDSYANLQANSHW